MATVTAGYERITVNPIAGAMGAEIEGVDLSQPLDDATFEEIRHAFLEHCVVFFRNQSLTPDQQKAFGLRFGTLNIHPFVKALDGHPEIIPIIKEREDKANFGGGWHSDVSFMEEPALGSVLYALETPDFGGDTLWANQYLAYDALSDGMKAMLDGLTAIHSPSSQYAPGGESDRNNAKRKSMAVAVSEEAMFLARRSNQFDRHDPAREPSAPEIPVRPFHARTVHLPLPLAAGLLSLLG